MWQLNSQPLTELDVSVRSLQVSVDLLCPKRKTITAEGGRRQRPFLHSSDTVANVTVGGLKFYSPAQRILTRWVLTHKHKRMFFAVERIGNAGLEGFVSG